MAIRSSKSGTPHDFDVVARGVVEPAIGDTLEGQPLPEDAGKKPAAVALGKLGGAKGGRARAEALSPAKRRLSPRRRYESLAEGSMNGRSIVASFFGMI